MRRILLIEDDPAFLHTLTEALQILNYQVQVQTNTKGIFEKICSFQPDLLLIDFTLENTNGGEICKQVKRNPEFSCMPVIIMSGYGDVADIAKEAAADDFLKKPFDISELDDKIEKCIGKRRKNLFRDFT